MIIKTFISVVFTLIWVFKPTVLLPQPGLERSQAGGRTRIRAQRDVACRHDEEYPYGNICCLNCPAGTHVISSCTTAGEKGGCESCDSGTYTEHSNGLKQCLKCTKCRSDQETVVECTSTQDTKCQCKLGSFCHPEQACEVCKKCSRCKEGEVEEEKCTPTNNTVCKKDSRDFSDSSTLKGCQRNPCDMTKVDDNQSLEETQNRENQRMDLSQLPLLLQPSQQVVSAKSSLPHEEDEDKGLGDSLANTASNSQSSLSVQPPTLFHTSSPKHSPTIPRQSNTREDEPFPELVAVNGEHSLRRTFEYFEEVDVDYHKRFFRLLGISDNVIKSKDNLLHEDRIHELLNIWMEKVGKEASINELLRALLNLNQRLTAENVMAKAVENGYYSCKKE
ncbi:hematopoietic death receptor isoform X2 [Lampris incognitus]|uniref:hematopoietic death receptor isoform X2 n=1 Tax=Lampris incognitus TaxID=2546036 RepID=UPI0024B552A4|nr:hematopoietic death receptor isoform X2 [Lampris incognitus]